MTTSNYNLIVSDSLPPASVPELFRSQVALRGEDIAVVAADEQLTYRELQLRADAVASELDAMGVGSGDRVGICMARSIDMIVALIAILEVGAAYVPLEPTYPANRLSLVLEDSQPVVVLADRVNVGILPEVDVPVRILEDISARANGTTTFTPPDIDPETCAYIMYTSGSTGTPKGVAIPHRAIDRLVREVDYVRLGPEVRLLHAAPIAFDASTFEVWGALLNGGRLILYPDPVPTAAGLRTIIRQHGVTTLWLTAGLFNAVIDEDPETFAGVAQLLTGGEALSVPHVRRALDALPLVQLINGYGPTEVTTFAACNPIVRPLPESTHSIPIGRPIRHTELLILDESGAPVADGDEGELFIAGRGVALGYVNRPELTSKCFVAHPGQPGEVMYRTGDRVRLDANGLVVFLGRADRQVKVRGFRIELSEIEIALMGLDGVTSAVVAPVEQGDAERRLVAYLVLEEGQETPNTSALREALAQDLPSYMVPGAFVVLDALPLNPNGKVDHAALPTPPRNRPELSVEYVAPQTPLEEQLCATWADALGWEQVGVLDNLFDLGATSLLVVRTLARMRDEFDLSLPVTAAFEFPSVAGQARLLSEEREIRTETKGVVRRVEAKLTRDAPVAIVGMAGRFPGAADVDEFWRNLCDGAESITTFTADELDPHVPAESAADPAYVRARGILDDVDLFDAAFFGMTPREAAITDPQQRVLLEVAWETLESAGYDASTFGGVVGVFAGKYNNSYYENNVLHRPELIAQFGEFQTMVANEKDYVATRLAHKLDLTGPAVSVHTACSTSLVATALAVRSLQFGECDMALAGGVALTVPVKSGYIYQEGAMLSSDGRTRPFDAGAQGTVFSDGAAMVLLKRLTDAQADGDTIYGVIRGCAVNNDGADKASFTAPSVAGQKAVVESALADANVSARELTFVEAHGTATPLGDPIEVDALTRAFRTSTDEVGFCALGSLKSNVGHMVIAAGVAGLIKTALSLKERLLPPSINFSEPNPAIDFANSPFFVNTTARPLGGEDRLLAGVSSFGVGGTNAHVIVQEPPVPPEPGESRSAHVLMLSARSEAEVHEARVRLANRLEADPKIQLADAAFTLHAGRRAFPYRTAVSADSVEEAIASLRGDHRIPSVRKATGDAPRLALLFPGQGVQYPGMGKALYREHDGFRAHVDAACELLVPDLGRDLRELLFPDEEAEEAAAAELSETVYAQTSIFVIEHALARTWLDLGLRPHSMVGHSVGEFVCATLAGVMDLPTALSLVAARGKFMQAMPRGSMLSVLRPVADVEAMLEPGLEVAADNSLKLCVVSGPTDQIDEFATRLESEGVACRRLRTSHAFHSAMMDPAVEQFRSRIEQETLSTPNLPFVSSATGQLISDDEATDPGYWAAHLRNRVRFTEGVQSLLHMGCSIFLEVGPRSTLTALAGQQLTDRTQQRCLSSMGDSEADAFRSVLDTAGQLWCSGVAIDPSQLHGPGPRRRIPLPTYPFARKRFWVDRPDAPVVAQSAAAPAPPAVVERALPSGGRHADHSTVDTSPRQISEDDMPFRSQAVLAKLKVIIEETTGLEIEDGDETIAFIELGFDSLLLTQLALAAGREFNVGLTFRQLMQDLPDAATLSAYIASELPADAFPDAPISVPERGVAPLATSTHPQLQSAARVFPALGVAASSETVEAVLQNQLALVSQLMTQQMAVLTGMSGGTIPIPAAAQQPASAPAAAESGENVSNGQHASAENSADSSENSEELGDVSTYDVKKAFGAIARIHKANNDELTPKQTARLHAFIRRYNQKTLRSKEFTQENRHVVADPRVVTGFRPAVKELVYPIVVDRSEGSRLWDLDGNEYIDALNGFGISLFGWQPDFVTKAVEAQLHRGHEIGPQSPLQAEVAKLICEFTGFDRAAFCNTGSEAVMGCARIARTVTGRSKVAIFSGAYHGIFDEVIVRGTKTLRSIPAAPGIMPSAAANVMVLEYGTDETLRILEEQADELAAIIVEPVQSRRPDFQPRQFLHDLRKLTKEHGIVYVFDEVVTGFRTCPGGCQQFFDVRADLGAYGKVVGGGLPIGVIAGQKQFMDALDGGHWEFGDDSAPPIGVTYFAGTFVRHPLALAAARAVLTHLKEQGPELQDQLNVRTTAFVDELNAFLGEVGAPMQLTHFASLWRASYTEAPAFGDLLFYMMRDRGVHIYDGFPCFFTTAHGEAEFATIAKAFKESILEMQDSGFLAGKPKTDEVLEADRPPVPGARLGRNPNGQPTWYVPSAAGNGKYVVLEGH